MGLLTSFSFNKLAVSDNCRLSVWVHSLFKRKLLVYYLRMSVIIVAMRNKMVFILNPAAATVPIDRDKAAVIPLVAAILVLGSS